MTGASLNQLEFALPGLSLDDWTENAILLLQQHEPAGGYRGCFSGGKDSCVIKEIARMAGVSVDWHYNVTTLDPPELVYFIRKHHSDVAFGRPEKNYFARLAEKNFLPTRAARWCCEEFKERLAGDSRMAILGIRAEESRRRMKDWGELTWHRRARVWTVLPIFQWREIEVWAFIEEHALPYCSLYDEGISRIGCIGCPLPSPATRRMEFARWPGYERLWRRAFERLWKARAGMPQRDGREWFGSARFSGWEEMWDCWIDSGMCGQWSNRTAESPPDRGDGE